jgi:signal peptidase I
VRNPIHRLPRPWSTVVDWIVTIAIAIAFVLAFEAEVAKPYRIPSASMEPTLHCARPARGCEAGLSDRVIALRLAYRFRDPARGDVVVFKAPALADTRCGGGAGGGEGRTFVKRIVGLPGETVSERDGHVFVDGRALAEPYVPGAERDNETASWPRVPRDSYFLMGDNRSDSCDSRMWGPVPRRDLIGPVVLTYWPPFRIDLR